VAAVAPPPAEAVAAEVAEDAPPIEVAEVVAELTFDPSCGELWEHPPSTQTL
jgi:hypothetical protein